MRRLIRFAGRGAALVALLVCVASSAMPVLDGGRFGDVREFQPRGDMRGMVLLFSDQGGWGVSENAAAAALAEAGALVVGIDTRSYVERLDAGHDACQVLIGDVEAMSRAAQRVRNTGPYLWPILSGIGEGGAVAAAALSQARVNTVAGAVSIDPAPSIQMRKPPCSDVSAMTAAPDAANRSPAGPQGVWSVGLRPGAVMADRVARWAAAGSPVDIHTLAPRTDEADALVALVSPHLAAPAAAPASAIASLPLIPLPAANPTGIMAIVISGDGGWRDIDKQVTDSLRARGVSVVGWDSLRYFWHQKTPEEVARDLAEVLRTYSTLWRSKQVILIGYSFGADVMPFAFNRLPQDLQAKVTMMTLLALSNAADFEIRVSGWLGASPSATAVPVGAEVDRIPGRMIQCVYGQDETDTACPGLEAKGVEIVRTPGGHHFDNDYVAVATRILDGLARRRS